MMNTGHHNGWSALCLAVTQTQPRPKGVTTLTAGRDPWATNNKNDNHGCHSVTAPQLNN